MKSTNAIEKALQENVNEECRSIVDKFILDMEKLSDKYGGSNYYEFTRPPMTGYPPASFSVDYRSGVAKVLHKMLLDNYSDLMLEQKSKELIKKLELI